MTLREILAVIWIRRWIIVVIIVCALLAAVAYLSVRTVSYTSDAKIRLNSVVAGGATSDDIGGVAVDFGEQTITSPAVLDAAGKIIGEPGSALANAVSASVADDGHTTSVAVHATGPTARDAQVRAAAVIKAYTARVDAAVASVLVVLQQRQQVTIAQAQTLQRQVAADPGNSIASTNLATALSRMSSTATEIDSINNAGPSASVLRAATLGESTVPSVIVVLLLAIATGLVVGTGTALIRDQFDDRLRGEEDAKLAADVPILGGLAWDRRVAKSKVPLPVAGNARTDLGEGLRTLRSNLQVLLPPHGVVVVTSIEPGDGKSFVSSNLALAWARAGKKVVLVGGDLRKPDLQRYFGDAALGQGVAEILSRDAQNSATSSEDADSLLQPSGHEDLWILPAGQEPSEPADLLARAGLGQLIASLRASADFVIIDSPPAMGMADAALLAAHADGAIVIATQGRTIRARLTDALLALGANGASVLGIVVNRSTRRLPRTYSAYYLRESSVRRPAAADHDDEGAPEPAPDMKTDGVAPADSHGNVEHGSEEAARSA